MGKNRIALASAFAQNLPMLPRALSADESEIKVFSVEVEVNSGWGAACRAAAKRRREGAEI
jgi:hypothetical protein